MMKPRLEPEYEQAYTEWKTTPSPQATGKLLTAVQPVLQMAERTYGGARPSPTLTSRAKVLAADAFKSYDPNRGSMRNHLMSNLQRLRRYSAQEQQIVRVPELASIQRNQLFETEKRFQAEYGRAPTTRELTDEIGISRKKLESLRRGVSLMSEGTAARSIDSPEAASMAREKGMPAWMDMAYDDLPARDQLILERSLGLYGNPVQSPAAIAKALGVSQAAISKRMAYLQQYLDSWEDQSA
jgi:DNA-directed RNA polymerase specialized sigma subunit